MNFDKMKLSNDKFDELQTAAKENTTLKGAEPSISELDKIESVLGDTVKASAGKFDALVSQVV